LSVSNTGQLQANGSFRNCTTADTKTSVYYINKCGKCEELFLERDMKQCLGKKYRANTSYDIPSTLLQDSNRLPSKNNWNRKPEDR